MPLNDARNPINRLKSGEILILDGALGTELERMSAISISPIWSAEAIDLRSELLLDIHKEYIWAGADIITCGTFRSTKRALAKVGLQNEAERLTRKAVEIARCAVREANPSRSIYIAGSMAPLEDCYSPNLVPTNEECEMEHEYQASLLAECGVDIILCETFNTVREGVIALRAAKKQGLPTFLSFTCKSSGDIMNGESFADLVEPFSNTRPDCLMVNCTPTTTLHASLTNLTLAWDGILGAYGNVGQSNLQNWEFSGDVSASSYLEYAKKWVILGAQVVGGCCGTNPDYIRHLSYHLPKRVPSVL